MEHPADTEGPDQAALRAEARRLLERRIEIDHAFDAAFAFDGARCDRIVARTLERIAGKREDNPTAKSLAQGGQANMDKLKSLRGKAFDKAYIDHEVAYHQQVIDALDKVLIPSAKNEELKSTLVKVRPAFIAHLEHAKHIQAAYK